MSGRRGDGPVVAVTGGAGFLGGVVVQGLLAGEEARAGGEVYFVTLDFTFRTDKAHRHLGYVPPLTPAEATEHTVAWIRSQGGGGEL